MFSRWSGELPKFVSYKHTADTGVHAEHVESVLSDAVVAAEGARCFEEYRADGKTYFLITYLIFLKTFFEFVVNKNCDGYDLLNLINHKS